MSRTTSSSPTAMRQRRRFPRVDTDLTGILRVRGPGLRGRPGEPYAVPAQVTSLAPEGLCATVPVHGDWFVAGKRASLELELCRTAVELPVTLVWQQERDGARRIGARVSLELATAKSRQAFADWIGHRVDGQLVEQPAARSQAVPVSSAALRMALRESLAGRR